MAGRKQKKNVWRRKLKFMGSCVVCLFSALWICHDFLQGKSEEAAFSRLRISAVEQTAGETGAASGCGPVEKGKDSSDAVSLAHQKLLKEAAGFLTLKGKNHDYVGWIAIPGTSIDYPVMDRKDDPEYYLHRAFDGTKTSCGTPFLGEASDPDSTCMIIYGHHMKNGAVFGSLDAYRKKDYWNMHPEICFYINGEVWIYEIFAAVKTEISENFQETENFPYYRYDGTLSEDESRKLCGWLIGHSEYDTGIIPENTDQIMMLSTCSYHAENGRFVVAARKRETIKTTPEKSLCR